MYIYIIYRHTNTCIYIYREIDKRTRKGRMQYIHAYIHAYIRCMHTHTHTYIYIRTYVRNMTWHDMTRHDTTWHDRTRHDTTLHYIIVQCITLHYITYIHALPYLTLDYLTLHYSTLRYLAVAYATTWFCRAKGPHQLQQWAAGWSLREAGPQNWHDIIY